MPDSRPPSEGGGRSLALLAAALLAALAIAVVVWSVVTTNTPNSAASANEAPEATLFPDSSPTAATNEPARPSGAVEELLGPSFEASDDGRIEFVDETGAVERELLYETLEPREGGRIEVTKPQAWLRLAGGGIAHLEADRGSLLQPQGRREPESGRFDGNVRVRVYEDDPRPEFDTPPSVTFATESLNFDTTMGELRTSDDVRITSPGVDVQFTGFTLIVDEVRQRLALFQTTSAGRAVIDPSKLAKSERDSGKDAPGGDPSAVAAMIETLYHAELTGDVAIASGARRATSERFDLWARLLNNRPTERTLEGLRALSSPSSDSSETTSETTDSSSRPAETITVAWSNGLTVRPRDETPAELAEEDAFARLASPSRGVVRIDDATTGFSTTSVALDYGVSAKNLTWTGVGPRGVILRAEELFEATTNRFELDLATGDAYFPGPGVMVSLGVRTDEALDAPVTPAQILWRDRGHLSFARNNAGMDFAARPLVTRAQFNGAVRASDDGVSVTGEQLQSFFALDAAGRTTVSRTVVTDNARVDGGPLGLLTANRLDIEFDLDAPSITPTVATAQGDVRAARDGSTLRADLAEATFERDASGRTRVAAFSADLGVVVQTADGVRMTCDSLRADPERSVADLTGEPAVITLADSAVSGTSMRIDQIGRTLTVFGRGELRRTGADESLGYESVVLTWADSMQYDDLAGEAQFLGECVLTADVSELARDVLTAGRIDLFTTPFGEREQRGDGRQTIERAVAYGAASGVSAMDLARVESRRYVADALAPGGLRLTRLIYLDGPEIIAEIAQDELRVPHPGKLLIENRRADGAESDANEMRGTTLIEWDGTFALKRDVGSAEFRRQVRVRHRPPGAPKVTELECERLDLSFDPSAPAEGSAAAPELVWAQAQGAVYAAQGRRQVIADRLLFDNSLGFAELTAWPGNVVTLYDADAPTPLTGELLRWDLLRDRVEWRGARPTAAPD